MSLLIRDSASLITQSCMVQSLMVADDCSIEGSMTLSSCAAIEILAIETGQLSV